MAKRKKVKAAAINGLRDLESLVSESIANVMCFLEESGIYLGKLPTFAYTSDYSPASRQFFAQCPGELLTIRRIGEMQARGMMERNSHKMLQKYKIVLSEEAMEEYISESLLRARKIKGMDDKTIERLNSYNAEIIIFKPAYEAVCGESRGMARGFIEPLMAHETWHVVEMRLGLFENFYAIEGTAESFREMYHKWRGISLTSRDVAASRDEDAGRAAIMQLMQERLYQKGKDIINAHASSVNDLLNPAKRTLMNQAYLGYLEEEISKMVEAPEPTDFAQAGAITRLMFPEMDILDRKFSKEGYLTGCRNAGMAKMASELSSQNCTLILENYAKLGYGPNQQLAGNS